MKKYLIVIFVFATFLFSCESEPFVEEEEELVERIFDGSIRLQTQEDVNIFGAEEYTTIIGSLRIGVPFGYVDEEPITDLSPLSSLRRIGFSDSILSEFRMDNNQLLTSLYGLHNLESIYNFLFYGNHLIEDFTELESLIEIGDGLAVSRTFVIADNQSLLSLQGLEALRRTGRFVIASNPLLQNLDGINNLTEVGSVEIGDNPSLENLDALSNLIRVQSSLKTHVTCGGPYWMGWCSNANLYNLCGLQNLFVSGAYNPEKVDLTKGPFTPTIDDIIEGDCSL